ncbi:MAG: hypothetical protein D6781_06935 [Verrucomicrobia bacterium]|nr:MAG: hypothetical protein D6781_06935 [Verrucomicrobiota bacterium]
MSVTQSRIATLPKWAQKLISELVYELNEALSALQRFEDEQTPGPVSVSEHVCDGAHLSGRKRAERVKFIQAERVNIDHRGVKVAVSLSDRGVTITWRPSSKAVGGAAMVPTGVNQVELVAKETLGKYQ